MPAEGSLVNALRSLFSFDNHKQTALKIRLRSWLYGGQAGKETKLTATQVSYVHVRALIGKELDLMIWNRDIWVPSLENLGPPKSP